MKKTYLTLFVATFLAVQLLPNTSKGQCSWHTVVSDGFEYTTSCPYVDPSVVYTTVPQSYSVHGGAKSLYLNFVNCAGGVGTCAGDTVFSREISVCSNINQRISAYLTTTFAGAQCNMLMLILDANNNVIDSANVLAAYSPTWTYYQSATFVSPTPTIKFVIVTNVDGGNGNDLSMDDFLMENCWTFRLGNDTTICNTQIATIDAGSGYLFYLWDNGSINQTVVASTTNMAASVHFYIVQVTDSNGCSFKDTLKVTFLPCSGLNELGNANNTSVYPNPATDQVIVESSNLTLKNTFFVLSDATGRELKKIEIENSKQTISFSNVSSGIYFYSIVSEKGIEAIGKIRKE